MSTRYTFPFDGKSAKQLYKLNEHGGGGFFPIGANNHWHGGVHLHYGAVEGEEGDAPALPVDDDPESPVASVSNADMWDSGSGPTSKKPDVLICFAGYKGSLEGSKAWANSLVGASDALDKVGRVLAVRGPVKTNPPVAGKLAEWVRALVESNAVPPHFYVVAHSSGAYVANELFAKLVKLELPELDGRFSYFDVDGDSKYLAGTLPPLFARVRGVSVAGARNHASTKKNAKKERFFESKQAAERTHTKKHWVRSGWGLHHALVNRDTIDNQSWDEAIATNRTDIPLYLNDLEKRAGTDPIYKACTPDNVTTDYLVAVPDADDDNADETSSAQKPPEGPVPVHAVASGTLIAYRINPEPTTVSVLGKSHTFSTDFALIHHEHQTPKGQKIEFFSLYMHLLPLGAYASEQKARPSVLLKHGMVPKLVQTGSWPIRRGDLLGYTGPYLAQRSVVHFETFTAGVEFMKNPKGDTGPIAARLVPKGTTFKKRNGRSAPFEFTTDAGKSDWDAYAEVVPGTSCKDRNHKLWQPCVFHYKAGGSGDKVEIKEAKGWFQIGARGVVSKSAYDWPDWKRIEKPETFSDNGLADATELADEIDKNHDHAITRPEMIHALRNGRMRDKLHRLAIKHPTEWGEHAEALKYLTGPPWYVDEKTYEKLKDKIAELQFWKDVGGKLPAPDGVWHLHPIGFVEHMARFKPSVHDYVKLVYEAFGYELPAGKKAMAILGVRELQIAGKKGKKKKTVDELEALAAAGWIDEVSFVPESREREVTRWNDLLFCVYGGDPAVVDVFQCTIDPGEAYSGVYMPLLVEGHLYHGYPGSHQAAKYPGAKTCLHIYSESKGKILLLRDHAQKGSRAMKGKYRQAVLDGKPDWIEDLSGRFCEEEDNDTIHMHFGSDSGGVGTWSVGCTVLRHKHYNKVNRRNVANPYSRYADFLKLFTDASNKEKIPYLVVSSKYVETYPAWLDRVDRLAPKPGEKIEPKTVIKESGLVEAPDTGGEETRYLSSFMTREFADAVVDVAEEKQAKDARQARALLKSLELSTFSLDI